MSISIMGSVNSYTKTMKLQTQWNLKQKTGDYSSHKKSLEEWISTAQEALKKSQNGYGNTDNDEESNKKLNAIMEKIYAGKKLTDKERRFLQAKNPQAYEKLRSIEREQKAYEQKLRQCKTKEEVQRLKMNQIASSLSVIGSVRNNPNISQGKKLEICMQEKMRCDRMEESTQNFVRSGEYNRLPTEAEQAKAQQEEREKLEAALKPQEEQTEKTEKVEKAEKTEKTESPEQSSPETKPAEANSPQPETKPVTEKPAATSSASQTGSPKKVVIANAAKPAQSTPETDASPELRKVRRARRQAARAAYTAAQTTGQSPSQPAISINA